jgi:LacI family transcriptional regulator
MKKPVPTIRDVAAAAQASRPPRCPSSSTARSGSRRRSRRRSTQVIAELGYRSNPLAQVDDHRPHQYIGLSVLDIGNPHFTGILKGANRVAQAHGYTLLLVDTEETPSRERPLLEALSRRVDGMIVFSRMREAEMDWMAELGQAAGVLRPAGRRCDLPWVASDDHRGACMLTRHLIMLGHKKVAYLGFSKSRRDEERLGGIRECLAEQGLQLAGV